MPIVIAGVVNNGVIVPQEPLPEGVRVEIHVSDQTLDVPAELQEELAAWQQASANALALVERLAQESPADEKR
jgi:predicted DNA-binding antitoxin AbrB/MazE fold protein